LPGKDLPDVVAGGICGAADLKDRADLGKTKPGCAAAADKPQPLHGVLTVVAVTVGGTFGSGQKTAAFIEAKGFGCHAGSCRCFADPHSGPLLKLLW
jgi:hypothetical protein